MADELTSRSEALQTADRLRRQMLADVSHELKTPLTTMRGYLETLRMAGVGSRRGDARALLRHPSSARRCASIASSRISSTWRAWRTISGRWRCGFFSVTAPVRACRATARTGKRRCGGIGVTITVADDADQVPCRSGASRTGDREPDCECAAPHPVPVGCVRLIAFVAGASGGADGSRIQGEGDCGRTSAVRVRAVLQGRSGARPASRPAAALASRSPRRSSTATAARSAAGEPSRGARYSPWRCRINVRKQAIQSTSTNL